MNGGALPGHISPGKGTDPHRRCSLPLPQDSSRTVPSTPRAPAAPVCTSWRWSSEDKPGSWREHGNIELGACTG